MASLVGGIENLVVEDREVQGKTQANRVSGGEFGLGDFGGSLVCFERLVGRFLAAVTNGELGKVTVVVTLPMRELSILSWIDGILTNSVIKTREKQTNILW